MSVYMQHPFHYNQDPGTKEGDAGQNVRIQFNQTQSKIQQLF